MKKRSKTTLTALVLGLVALALMLGAFFAGRRVSPAQIREAVDREVSKVNEAHKGELHRLNAQIEERDARLKASESRYRDLVGKIKQKAAEKVAIKAPEGENEIEARMENLGYRPLR